MGHYPFTLFNAITALILLLTVVVAWSRFGASLKSNWPLLYDAALGGYTAGFSGGLNPYWVAAAGACGIAIRFGFYPKHVRFVEIIALAYIVWRCAGLILMW